MKCMSFKSLAVLCALSLQLSSLPAFALRGGMDGGGGGVYKLDNGKYVTLPEFGVLIEDRNTPKTTGKTYLTYYSPSEEVDKELKAIEKRIQSLVPSFTLFDQFSSPVKKKEIFVQTKVDPVEYKKAKDEYRQVLKAFGYQLLEDKFILPAVTIDGITYLLPDFDNLLPPQQAKILIHEQSMRRSDLVLRKGKERLDRLQRALTLDTAITEILAVNSDEEVDLLKTLSALAKLKMIDDEAVFEALLVTFLKEIKKPIYDTRVFIQETNYELILDPHLIQQLSNEFSLRLNYAEIFEGTTAAFSTAFSFDDSTKNFCRQIKQDDMFAELMTIMDNKPVIITCRLPSYASLTTLKLGQPGPFIKKFFQ